MREPPPERFAPWIELSSERLGGSVPAANDEFFAPKELLLAPTAPVFDAERYTDDGKWMDGWETRRRREPGNDWAVVRLGLAGRPRGAVVDTRHFLGNYPEACSIEGAFLAEDATQCDAAQWDVAAWEAVDWRPLLGRQPLAGGTVHEIEIRDAPTVNHVRLSIYPDGGVARLRVFGEVTPPPTQAPGSAGESREIDLAALVGGGRVVASSDMFFGNANNLLLPGDSIGMFDGWETRRRRGPGNDWAVVRLGQRGLIARLEVDTAFFKGNAPGACRIEAADLAEGDPDAGTAWRVLVEKVETRPHHLHRFEALPGPAATHLRLSIYPDGGVARLRAFGLPQEAESSGT